MSFQILSEAEPVGRKDYRCIWCGELIPNGEKHFLYTGKDGSDFQSNRMHLECRGAMYRLHATDRYAVEDGFTAGGFARGCGCERGCCECAKPADLAGRKAEG